ncbi:type II toxin-antitoxin system RelE/ParE family toxin [Enterovirga aerilata]|uniref:Type II toxin-antitoxin system RelE/ParE family toxin n=1 Tax=Enterovirga aerilata TaxID=2730920 RepID=A0A849HZR6_9HYPH|nr:type II toxin-antitoxin system RelE/ParE family toxin [Enterovirga sp. DB1703]
MRVIVSLAARKDLSEIADYIARENPRRAESFTMELVAAARAIAETPFAWPVLSRHRTAGVRRKLHGRYLILYRMRQDRVEIVRIVHGARDLRRLPIDPPSE